MTLSARINIVLSSDTYSRLRTRCDATGTAMSTVVRTLIDRELDAPTETATVRRKPEPRDQQAEREAAERAVAERNEEIRRMRGKGMNYRDIAAIVGLTESGVCRAAKRMGL